MEIKIRGFTSPKIKEKYKDNFDRIGYNLEENKFTVCDGVTLSFYPDVWVKLIVENFLSNGIPINIDDVPIELDSIQEKWLQEVEERVNRPEAKYYARNKFKLGGSGSTTFVGLQFFMNENNTINWKAIVLGDSFMFYVPKKISDKKNKCFCCNVKKFFKKEQAKEPLKNCTQNNDGCPDYINADKNVLMISSKSDLELDNSPDYFDSRNEPIKGNPIICEGELTEGYIYLMTDALADWFIQNKNSAEKIMNSWTDHSSFINGITLLREKEVLKNDDTSILILEVIDDKQVNIKYELGEIDNFEKLLKKENNEQSLSSDK
jgi:hypothetical protein